MGQYLHEDASSYLLQEFNFHIFHWSKPKVSNTAINEKLPLQRKNWITETFSGEFLVSSMLKPQDKCTCILQYLFFSQFNTLSVHFSIPQMHAVIARLSQCACWAQMGATKLCYVWRVFPSCVIIMRVLHVCRLIMAKEFMQHSLHSFVSQALCSLVERVII